MNILQAIGPDWIIENQEVVTATNQADFPAVLDDYCPLKQQAKLSAESTAGDYASYVPPVGWTVVQVRRRAGASSSALYEMDDLWIDPKGKIWSTASCVGKVLIESPTEKLKLGTMPQESSSGLLLLAGLAILGLMAFSD